MVKKLLIIGAGPEQCNAIREAQELGYYAVASDQNKDAPGFRLANDGEVGKIDQAEFLTDVAKRHAVSGIVCHALELSYVQSIACERLGLPMMHSVATAAACTFKLPRLKWFKKAGLSIPKFSSFDRFEDFRKYCMQFAGCHRVVIKPGGKTTGAAGVSIISSSDHRAASAAWVKAKKACSDWPVIVEDFIAGEQWSIEVIVVPSRSKKDLCYVYTASRNYPELIFPIEDGHSCPASCNDANDLDKKAKIIMETISALRVKAVGLSSVGPLKLDVVWHGDDLIVLEVATRTSGGRFLDGTVPLAHSCRPLRAVIQLAAGDPVDARNLEQRYSNAACQRYFMPPAGIVESITGLEEAKAIAAEVYLPLKPGDRTPAIRSHRDRSGYVIAVGRNSEEAEQLAEAARAAVKIEIVRIQ